MDDIIRTMRISGSGMRVQGPTPPRYCTEYRERQFLAARAQRKSLSSKGHDVQEQFDRATGLDMVKVNRERQDMSDFGKRYEPNHPAADANGYVLTPNVNTIIELSDMREAQRSYEANMNVIKASKAMLNSAIELLR